jgi:hypothetical protein
MKVLAALLVLRKAQMLKTSEAREKITVAARTTGSFSTVTTAFQVSTNIADNPLPRSEQHEM